MGGKSSDQVVGYNYFFGIHMGISRGPVDELVEIKVGDRTAWPEPATDPNAPPEAAPEYDREYPPGLGMNPAFGMYLQENGDTYVKTLIETPETFVAGSLITITNLVRMCLVAPTYSTHAPVDVSGEYTVVERVNTQHGIMDGGDWGTIPGYLMINIGTDPALVAAWTKIVNPDPSEVYPGQDSFPANDDPVIIEVDPSTTGGAGEASETATQSTRIFINAPELFGGEGKEGGIKGNLDVMMGEDTQLPGADLTTMLGGDVPGFRGMFTAFFDGLIASLNPYPKAWKFRVRRGLKGWDGAVWHPELCVLRLKSDLDTYSYRVLDYGRNVPPVSPDEGDAYITGATASGAWSGNTELLAVWTNGAWVFTNPENGWVIYSVADDAIYTYDGDVWSTVGSPDIHAMNPAHILYECLTNRAWGRGLSRTMIDDGAFLAAATTLAAENFGLCLRWSRRDTIESFVQSVLDHIGATLYTNRTTGKLSLKLIRADYVVADLPLFDPNNGLIEIKEQSTGSPSKYVNELRVKYRDPVTDQDRVVKTDALASLQANGGAFVALEKNYPGIATAALALKVAQRDLRANGTELRRFNLTLDRRAWDVTPGDAIRVRDLTQGIGEMVVRVGRFEDGTLTDGKIKIVAVQDVFGLPAKTFVKNQTSTAPAGMADPCVGNFKVFEWPYVLLAGNATAAEFAAFDMETGLAGVVMERGGPGNSSYTLAVRAGLPEEEDIPEASTGYCGFPANGWSCGTSQTCFADYEDAQADMLAIYNEANGGGWEVDPDYPVVDGVPVETMFRKLVGMSYVDSPLFEFSVCVMEKN